MRGGLGVGVGWRPGVTGVRGTQGVMKGSKLDCGDGL